MKKTGEKAQANVVTIVLVVFIVLAAFVLTYNIVKPMISSQTSEISGKVDNIRLMNALTVDQFSSGAPNTIAVTVTRDSTPGEITGIKYTVKNTLGASCTVETTNTLNILETKTFTVDISNCTGVVQSVTAVPVLGEVTLDESIPSLIIFQEEFDNGLNGWIQESSGSWKTYNKESYCQLQEDYQGCIENVNIIANDNFAYRTIMTEEEAQNYGCLEYFGGNSCDSYTTSESCNAVMEEYGEPHPSTGDRSETQACYWVEFPQAYKTEIYRRIKTEVGKTYRIEVLVDDLPGIGTSGPYVRFGDQVYYLDSSYGYETMDYDSATGKYYKEVSATNTSTQIALRNSGHGGFGRFYRIIVKEILEGESQGALASVLGEELVINGDFDNGENGWTLTLDGIKISNGKAIFNGPGSPIPIGVLDQTINGLTAGNDYNLSFIYNTAPQTSCVVLFEGEYVIDRFKSYNPMIGSETITFSQTITAQSTSAELKFMCFSAYSVGIDDVSLKEIKNSDINVRREITRLPVSFSPTPLYTIRLFVDVNENANLNAYIISEKYPLGHRVIGADFGGVYNTTSRLAERKVEWLAAKDGLTELGVEDTTLTYVLEWVGNSASTLYDLSGEWMTLNQTGSVIGDNSLL